MGLFSILSGSNINKGLEEYRNTEGAVLLDVRSPGEYRGGHIPGSRNVPVQEIRGIEKVVPDKDTPIFTYCASGSRSSSAAGFLRSYGYRQVINIGGISGYRGEVESGK